MPLVARVGTEAIWWGTPLEHVMCSHWHRPNLTATRRSQLRQVIEPELPASTKEDGINTVEKILNVRTSYVDCLEPRAAPPPPASILVRRTKQALAALVANCSTSYVESCGYRTKVLSHLFPASSAPFVGSHPLIIHMCDRGCILLKRCPSWPGICRCSRSWQQRCHKRFTTWRDRASF